MSLRKKLSALEARPIPKGWSTAEQIAKREGLAQSSILKFLARCVKARLLERKMWRMAMRNGILKPMPIYREINEAKK